MSRDLQQCEGSVCAEVLIYRGDFKVEQAEVTLSHTRPDKVCVHLLQCHLRVELLCYVL